MFNPRLRKKLYKKKYKPEPMYIKEVIKENRLDVVTLRGSKFMTDGPSWLLTNGIIGNPDHYIGIFKDEIVREMAEELKEKYIDWTGVKDPIMGLKLEGTLKVLKRSK